MASPPTPKPTPSTKELAATLPRKAPNTERHRAVLNAEPGQYKYQIYGLGPAFRDKSLLAQLEREINDAAAEDGGGGNGNSVLSSQVSKFVNEGSTLRDVYDYHVKARDEDVTVHPLYFVVADRADWKKEGLLAVHLDCGYGEEEDRVGVGRCGVDWAGSWGVNLDIGNMDWVDLKEMEEQEWGGEDPYADDEDVDGGKDDAGNDGHKDGVTGEGSR